MSIKNYIGILLLLAFQFNLSAQKDTTYQTIRQENGDFSTPIIETPADRLFRSKVPSNWMFKLNFAESIKGGAEYKISPAFSIGAYYGISYGDLPTDKFLNTGNTWNFSPSLALEGRWYHDIKKRIKTGRGANNFGGKYLALEASSIYDNASTIGWNNRRIALRYGLQQRFLRNGYFDISIGAGITDGSFNSKVFSTDQRASVGLAAFLPKQKKSAQNRDLCDVLHCQDEQYKMLRINLYNVVDIRSTGETYYVALQPNIAYERKIGRSPFSVEIDLGAAINSSKFRRYTAHDQMDYSGRYTSAHWNATGELRWYYKMRKRMLSGRSGNNLSGVFLGLQLNRNNLIKEAVNIDAEELMDLSGSNYFVLTGDYWTSNLVWGVQQRLLDRGFIQFKIGAGSTLGGNNYRYEDSNKPLAKIGRRNELNILADLKIGFAF